MITSYGGNDKLNGKGGIDLLSGGAGNDAFVFNTTITAASKTTISDFVSGSDRIDLSSAILTNLPAGNVSKDAFWIGTAAHDSTDRLIYNDKTGVLTYDFDGSGSGAAIEIATLSNGEDLLHSDFWVFRPSRRFMRSGGGERVAIATGVERPYTDMNSSFPNSDYRMSSALK